MSDPPTLLGPAAVVRYRRDVLDACDLDAGVHDRADRRLTPGAGPLDEHVDLANAMFHCAPGTSLCSKLGGERRRFTRTLEADVAGRRPCKDVALQVADGHDRVVERALDVSDPV